LTGRGIVDCGIPFSHRDTTGNSPAAGGLDTAAGSQRGDVLRW
jgi:hypothetical protein